ncbi:STAS domain-containing protein [Dactylosporangium aurantiacum]|uniref:Anti-sigma factor antagonist n=1 Tax=Dactylosporangium aurantiacum TaxID=35754 RepID=A0A9Q9M9L4_9ACTN|nr:STAS domain-containing protein [Dactylosporangium aurantiacum]MDG6106706.1 STAS domain-containing protein [Dactylosporangium aurantiacum]UWZ50858.1 STAS domain-containing protein [Dactylosporangium aurantiacum]
MALTLSTTRDDDPVVISVAGDVDLSTAAELEGALATAVGDAASGVVVDLAGVTFIDSAGINALLKGKRLADERGQRFSVANPAGVVRDVLELTGVLGHLSG